MRENIETNIRFPKCFICVYSLPQYEVTYAALSQSLDVCTIEDIR